MSRHNRERRERRRLMKDYQRRVPRMVEAGAIGRAADVGDALRRERMGEFDRIVEESFAPRKQRAE